MSLQCGIVGLPNVGKSTLFNALAQTGIAAENYPFCTIEPNVGVVATPDPRLQRLAGMVGSARVIPATMEFVDIAGLVAGAAKGEGLGNRFLAAIREADAVLHMVRCFDDDNIVHVAGKISPADDIAVIHTELALADLETVERAVARCEKGARSGDKAARAQLALLRRAHAHLDAGEPIRSLPLDDAGRAALRELHLLTAKPTLYIANVAEEGFADNPLLDRVRAVAEAEGAATIPLCAAVEAELTALDAAERVEFLAALGLEEPGLNRVIRAGYALLGLQTFFTVGPKEARAWTIPVGATAPQAAGKIHTDFERGFIRAEVIAYDDFLRYDGEQGARAAGKARLEGKEYIVQDGDVIHFRHNV